MPVAESIGIFMQAKNTHEKTTQGGGFLSQKSATPLRAQLAQLGFLAVPTESPSGQ